MQRGECAVLHASVKHRSRRVQKSDLHELRTAEILFFLCITYFVRGFVQYFKCLQKCFINFVMHDAKLDLIWKAGPREEAILKVWSMFPLLVWGALDMNMSDICHLGLEKAQMAHKEWEMVKYCVLLRRTEDTHENNALVSDLSTLGKILSPSKWFSCTTKVWGKLPTPVILNNVIYALFCFSHCKHFCVTQDADLSESYW